MLNIFVMYFYDQLKYLIENNIGWSQPNIFGSIQHAAVDQQAQQSATRGRDAVRLTSIQNALDYIR